MYINVRFCLSLYTCTFNRLATRKMATRKTVLCALVMFMSTAAAQTDLCTQLTNKKGRCMVACGNEFQPDPFLSKSFFACPNKQICCVPNPAYVVPTVNELDENCGLVSQGRILNGGNSGRCSKPFIVSIRARSVSDQTKNLDQNTTSHACAGVIISSTMVLTHPLCCYLNVKELSEVNTTLLVVAGEYDVTKQEQEEQFIRVEECIVHPDFHNFNLSNFDAGNNKETNGNAVALLRLKEPIKQKCASNVCLPSSVKNSATQTCDTLNNCFILGWGFTEQFHVPDTLKEGSVMIQKNNVCNLLTKILNSTVSRPNGTMCQVSMNDTTVDACFGDHGGPVLCSDGNRWSVQGIIPFNFCKEDNFNTFVPDVSVYEDWIRKTVERV